jgi:hypothetical protein
VLAALVFLVICGGEPPPPARDLVFLSYSHANPEWRDKVLVGSDVGDGAAGLRGAHRLGEAVTVLPDGRHAVRALLVKYPFHLSLRVSGQRGDIDGPSMVALGAPDGHHASTADVQVNLIMVTARAANRKHGLWHSHSSGGQQAW